MSKNAPQNTVYLNLVQNIQALIEKSKQQLAVTVNAAITHLYWNVGRRINQDVLQDKRATYGKQIISSLSDQLTQSYGRGWSERQLRNCMRIAEIYVDEKKLHAVSAELSWTHLKKLIYIEDELKRSFYIEICKHEKWSTRTLQERINSRLYERTAISKKPEETIKNELDIKLKL